MGDFKRTLGSLGAKLTQSVSDGVDALKDTAASSLGPTPMEDMGLEDDVTADAPAKIKKSLQMAASTHFKIQRKFASVATKFIAKHPPPISVDLQFDPEVINEILRRCQTSHCYSNKQLAWLDSIDASTPPRVPVAAEDHLLQAINLVSQHLQSGNRARAEEAAQQLQNTNPDLRHPVISDLCFQAAMRSVDQTVQHQAAIQQLESDPFNRNAAIVATQGADPASLRAQACDLILRKNSSNT
jgi:hypothetical protein